MPVTCTEILNDGAGPPGRSANPTPPKPDLRYVLPAIVAPLLWGLWCTNRTWDLPTNPAWLGVASEVILSGSLQIVALITLGLCLSAGMDRCDVGLCRPQGDTCDMAWSFNIFLISVLGGIAWNLAYASWLAISTVQDEAIRLGPSLPGTATSVWWAWQFPFIVLVAPLAEECFFRGFLLFGLAPKIGVRATIVLQAAMFGLIHRNPGHVITSLMNGIALGFIAWRSRSICLAIVFHMINNAIAYLMLVRYLAN